ncbi:MAG: non-hydrolyzing UDP-N-acetylglucosamine 2-epimerase [Syntrophobacteraceae bacterium]
MKKGTGLKVFLVAGARPNFMKIAPIYRESLNHERIECRVVHAGQHYDYAMSEAFFRDLGIPAPDFHLGAATGSHAAQTAWIMTAFEELCRKEHPDLVIVVGDVNSTLACSIVAKKGHAKLAHVEAGLRSFDLTMPEEINRMVTDSLSDYFFVTEESAVKNLLREGKNPGSIHFVGNVMIDNLFHQLEKLDKTDPKLFATFALKEEVKDYIFLTLHRPSNVDEMETFETIASALNQIASERAILFPVHPRTGKMIAELGINLSSNIHLLSPLGFQESLFLWKDSQMVLTDSGGLQEETTALGVPCVTIRENTERPITLEMGSNILAGTSREGILDSYRKSLNGGAKPKMIPKWDGKASERIWKALMDCAE